MAPRQFDAEFDASTIKYLVPLRNYQSICLRTMERHDRIQHVMKPSTTTSLRIAAGVSGPVCSRVCGHSDARRAGVMPSAGIELGRAEHPASLGYTSIAGMPTVTGFYTLLLPLLAFATFGSSRYLVVAADSATAAILAGGISGMAPIASAKYVALAGTVALLTAGFLLSRDCSSSDLLPISSRKPCWWAFSLE